MKAYPWEQIIFIWLEYLKPYNCEKTRDLRQIENVLFK